MQVCLTDNLHGDNTMAGIRMLQISSISFHGLIRCWVMKKNRCNSQTDHMKNTWPIAVQTANLPKSYTIKNGLCLVGTIFLLQFSAIAQTNTTWNGKSCAVVLT